MKKLNLSLEQIDALEKKENFSYQAGDNSLVITNYEHEGKRITGVREKTDDFYANEYFELDENENDANAILSYINMYLDIVNEDDTGTYDTYDVLDKIEKWSSQ